MIIGDAIYKNVYLSPKYAHTTYDTHIYLSKQIFDNIFQGMQPIQMDIKISELIAKDPYTFERAGITNQNVQKPYLWINMVKEFDTLASNFSFNQRLHIIGNIRACIK
jgi:hypothetical protein